MTIKADRLEPKKDLNIEDIARLDRPTFNRLIMERTFDGIGRQAVDLFELINNQFFDSGLPLPILLPANHGAAGTCYKPPFMVISLQTELFVSNTASAHFTMLHECIHLKHGLENIYEGDHDSDAWIDECQRLFDQLNIKVNLRDRPKQELKYWPKLPLMKFEGLWEYFEKSVLDNRRLEPLPNDWELVEISVRKFDEDYVIHLIADPNKDAEILVSVMGEDYCKDLASRLKHKFK